MSFCTYIIKILRTYLKYVLSPVCKAPIIVVFGLPLCCGYGVTGCKYVLCYIMQLSSLNHGYPSGGFFGLILLKIGVSVRISWIYLAGFQVLSRVNGVNMHLISNGIIRYILILRHL